MNFTEHYNQLIDLIDGLGQRERVLLSMMIFVLASLGWWNMLILPMQSKNVLLQSRERAAGVAVKVVEAELGGFSEAAMNAKIASVNNSFSKKTAELEKLNKKIESLGAHIVSQKEINEKIIRRLLEGRDGLRLINWDDDGNHPMFSEEQEANETTAHATDIAKEAPRSETPSITLNEQTFVIKFEGNYFAFLEYLGRIEQLGWQIFWEKLQYDVIQYPNAIISIRVGIPNISEG